MMENEAEKTSPSLVELHDKIKAENDRTAELLKKQEEYIARGLLGGRTDAGVMAKPVVEPTPQEYAKMVMSGQIKPTM